MTKTKEQGKKKPKHQDCQHSLPKFAIGSFSQCSSLLPVHQQGEGSGVSSWFSKLNSLTKDRQAPGPPQMNTQDNCRGGRVPSPFHSVEPLLWLSCHTKPYTNILKP